MARIASGERFELAPWLIPPASKRRREGEAQSRFCSPLKSKIGPRGFGQRRQSLVEEVAIVLVALVSHDRRIFGAAPALYRRVRHRKGARILDHDRNIHR